MEKVIKLHGNEEANILFGRHDENLKLIKKELTIQIASRGEMLIISGKKENLTLAEELIEELRNTIHLGKHIYKQEIELAIKSLKETGKLKKRGIFLDRISVMSKRQFITPKSNGQKNYIEAINNNIITFGIGPAGTGKTYLAIAMAVSALKDRQAEKIILMRPAVEAGESLGFLPGDLMEKIDPYLRPIYDAIYEMIDSEKVQTYLQKGIIEVVPLAYMRGRTLNDCFIILDEAQNSTPEQMKMFLTRLGFNSKVVVTGDITQIDLPNKKRSGLVQVQKILKGINEVKFVYLNEQDVVRHALVKNIIKAYTEFEKQAG